MEETTGPGVLTILVDHNIEGQATVLWATLAANGWLDLMALGIATLARVGLRHESSDREIWRFAQEHGMILLTDNRHRNEPDSLEQTIRDENTVTSLPVLTIGNANRMGEREYRERCAERLFEVVLYLDNYLGTGRIFIP